MSYDPVPDYRMPWDRDGTVYLHRRNQTITEGSADARRLMNNEAHSGIDNVPSGSSSGDEFRHMIIFPQERTLNALYARSDTSGSPQSCVVETSTDTTDGVDGTWTTLIASFTPETGSSVIKPGYRADIKSDILAVGIIGLAFRYTGATTSSPRWARLLTLHLYGSIDEGENPDRLRFWHPTEDEEIAPDYFDWGNIHRGSTADSTFRIKNNSETLTANSIELTFDVPTDASPSTAAQHELSSDGINFGASLSIGNLAPEAISGVLTLRRNIDEEAALGLWTLRVLANAGSWS